MDREVVHRTRVTTAGLMDEGDRLRPARIRPDRSRFLRTGQSTSPGYRDGDVTKSSAWPPDAAKVPIVVRMLDVDEALREARTLSEIGRHKAALAILLRAVNGGSGDARVLTAIAVAHLRQQRSLDAMTFARRAIAADPDADAARSVLVLALLERGRAAEAMVESRAAVEQRRRRRRGRGPRPLRAKRLRQHLVPEPGSDLRATHSAWSREAAFSG